MAARVAAALKVRFAPATRALQIVDPLAYDLYLQGREATRTHTREGLRQGNSLLQSAVARAPNFSAAWLELAKNCWRSGFLESIADQEGGFEMGRQAARRAIELDPKGGAAHGILAEMTPPFGHWNEIDAGLTRGLTLTPNDPDLGLWRGNFLLQTGRLKAATAALRRAELLDPLELYANHSLCVALTYTGAFKDAEAQAARLAAIWPDQIAGYWDRFWLLVTAGRDTEARAWLQDPRRPPAEPEEFAALLSAVGAASTGARSAAGRALTSLAREGIGYASNSMVLLARLGLADETLELARGLYLQEGPVAINRQVQFVASRRFPLHGEPEPSNLFHPFWRRFVGPAIWTRYSAGIGLTAFWRTAGRPDA